MPRKNHRRGRPQVRRSAYGTRVRHAPPPPPVETLIVPNGRCYRASRKGKLRFTADTVQKALEQARASRKRRGSGHVEERYYECKVEDGGCGDYHLTSRTTYEERNPS